MIIRKIIFLVLFSCIYVNAQQGEWTWIRGASTPGDPGTYGTQLVADALNNPSGTFHPVRWTDTAGNFWMFGGLRLSPFFGEMNDLWKYDPTTDQWTWMKGNNASDDHGSYGTMGVSSPTNLPSARAYGAASWVDLNGNLWMYGGDFSASGDLSDMWKYNISTNEWTWMQGSELLSQPAVFGTKGISSPSNTPGQRAECGATWVDANGDLWMFGGYVSGFGETNELWKYSVTTNEWTWMKGTAGPSNTQHYGTKMVEDSANFPSARSVYSSWKDLNGNFWFFGGISPNGEMNDMWKFNPNTNNWTWVSGDSTANSAGLFENTCTPALNHIPNARTLSSTSWLDKRGNFWVYSGGTGQSQFDGTNDLWMYCISNDEWIWINGDSVNNTAGHWGTQNVSDPANQPDARSGGVAWTSATGDLYMFGGFGPGQLINGMYNDLWKFSIDTNCAVCNSSTTEVNENPSLMEISVFPNPCHDILKINSDYPIERIELFDLTGKILLGKTVNSLQSELNLQNYAEGIYVLKIIASKRIPMIKAVKVY